jgi:lysophospholipase L1-like esterase
MILRVFATLLLLSMVTGAQSATPSFDVHAWMDRDHFREANAKLMEQKPDRRVIVLGGSMLASWDLGKSFAGKDYVNRSIAGQGTAQLVLRFNQDVTQLKPRVVVIVPGVDDVGRGVSFTDIQQNVIMMAQLAKAHGIRVAYASLPAVNPKGSSPLAAVVGPEKVRELNKWMYLYAIDHGDTYVDFWSQLGDPQTLLKPEYSGDGIALNEAAFKAIAPVLEKKMAEAIVAPSGKMN